MTERLKIGALGRAGTQDTELEVGMVDGTRDDPFMLGFTTITRRPVNAQGATTLVMASAYIDRAAAKRLLYHLSAWLSQ